MLGIGLGYALLSQDLTINGTSKVKGNTWDIHFNNVQISSESVSLSNDDSVASIDPNDNTLVNYTVTLNQPGDFYELRAGGATLSNNRYQNDSIYFNDNRDQLITAFGEANCYDDSNLVYNCNSSSNGFEITAKRDGSIFGYDNVSILASCGIQQWDSTPGIMSVGCFNASD